MSPDDLTRLEETVAHLTRVSEELSDIVARQEGEIDVLKRRVEMLMRREAEREAADGGVVIGGDDRPPPHY